MELKFKDIISIHGVPRSGTSWLGQIVDSSPDVRYKYQPLFSYAFKDRISLKSDKKDIYKYFNKLYDCDDEFLDQTYKKEKDIYPHFEIKKEKPSILATKMVRYHYLIPHYLEKINNIKFIFIVRNPCAVLYSWKNVPREFYEEWEFDQEWRFAQSMNKFRPEQYFGFHKWKEAVKLFIEMKKSYPKKVLLISYEDLVKQTKERVKDIYNFIDLRLTDQTKNFIEKSISYYQDDPSSVFKANKDIYEWKNNLDKNIINTIENELKNTEFEKFLK